MCALRETCCKGQIEMCGAGDGGWLRRQGLGDGPEKTWDNSSSPTPGKEDKLDSGRSPWTQLPVTVAVRTQLAVCNTISTNMA